MGVSLTIDNSPEQRNLKRATARILRVRAYLNNGDTAMQTVMKIITVGAVLALGMGTAVATAADNPFIGTWVKNNAKSTSTGADPWPKHVTRVYTESDQGVALTTKTTAADRKRSTTVRPAMKFDGMPHTVTITGDPTVDTVSVKQLGERMIEFTYMKAGKTTESGTGAVSNDGKTLTYTGKITTPTGEVFINIVNDKVIDKK
jgi:hypothetical protein